MCIPGDKTLLLVPILLTLTLKFDLLLKNFNLGCYLVVVAAWRVSLSSDNFLSTLVTRLGELDNLGIRS